MENDNEVSQNSPFENLVRRIKPRPRMIACSFNLPLWLCLELERAVGELRSKGRNITKRDLVTAALQQFLDVKEP